MDQFFCTMWAWSLEWLARPREKLIWLLVVQQTPGQVGERHDHRVQGALGGLERQGFEIERTVGGHGVCLPGSPNGVGAVDERRQGSTQAR